MALQDITNLLFHRSAEGSGYDALRLLVSEKTRRGAPNKIQPQRFQIEYTPPQSPKNFLPTLFSRLIAYHFTEKKPTLKYSWVDPGELLLF